MSRGNRVHKKLFIHTDIKAAHNKALISLGATVSSSGLVDNVKDKTVIRFSATPTRMEKIDKFYKDRNIELEEYTPQKRVYS